MRDMREDPAFQRLMDAIDEMPPLTADQSRIIRDALRGKVADSADDQDAVPADGDDDKRPADPA
jgi:hypothetical protein